MGLVQDLQGRKLTGCRGCDAVRRGLYNRLDLWKPDSRIQTASTHDSFDASALGAYIESSLKARGDSAATDLFSIDIENDTVDGRWVVTFFEHGDKTANYASGQEAIIYDGASVFQDGINFVSTSFAGAPLRFPNNQRMYCGDVATSDGYTTTTYRRLTSGNTTALPTGNTVDIETSATSAVIVSFSGYTECDMSTVGDDDTWFHMQNAPTCWNLKTNAFSQTSVCPVQT